MSCGICVMFVYWFRAQPHTDARYQNGFIVIDSLEFVVSLASAPYGRALQMRALV